VQTDSGFLSLQFDGSAHGQQVKSDVLTFLTRRGWRVVSESVQSGHVRGEQACCLALICLPLGFAADRTPDIVTVNLVTDRVLGAVTEHIHNPYRLDAEHWMCAVCAKFMTRDEVRLAKISQENIERLERQAQYEAARSQRARENAERTAQNEARKVHRTSERAEKQAQREALTRASPQIGVKANRTRVLLLSVIGIVLISIIISALVLTARSRAQEKAEWQAHLRRSAWNKAHPAEVAKKKRAERARLAHAQALQQAETRRRENERRLNDLGRYRDNWDHVKDGIALALAKIEGLPKDLSADDEQMRPRYAGLDLEFASRWIDCAYHDVPNLPTEYGSTESLHRDTKKLWDVIVSLHNTTDQNSTTVGPYAEDLAAVDKLSETWATASARMRTIYIQRGGDPNAIQNITSRVEELRGGASNDDSECPR
jgi:hypothetical protein